jgi:hypothetical protein
MMQGAGESSALHHLRFRETLYFSYELIPRQCPESERERAQGEVGEVGQIACVLGDRYDEGREHHEAGDAEREEEARQVHADEKANGGYGGGEQRKRLLRVQGGGDELQLV